MLMFALQNEISKRNYN